VAPLLTFTVTSPPGPSVSCVLIGAAGQSRQGGSSASASSGGGGWQVVDRARKGATTEWLDYYPIVLTLTCLLDGGTGVTAASVEPQIATLETFELPAQGTTPPIPPLLSISGPVPHTELTWACSRLEFKGGESTAIRDPNTGLRTQQSFSIELTQYLASDAITDPNLTPAQQAALSTSVSGLSTVAPVGTTYTVKKGDTWQSIAAQQLGNVALWPSIVSLNGGALGSIPPVGLTIQLPPAQS
jgi:LysM repeat protein